ncbi:MAG: phage minor capsid protein [Lachnospiraceae bacterium]|nr:phage minor capsid protein [Lachnospiraceae bacterium]
MLTEEQLDILPEALLPLFQNLEKEVIADIARRIQKTLTYTRTAELQALSMKGLGYSPAQIRKEVMKLLQTDKTFQKVVAQNTLAYKKEIKKQIELIIEAARAANNEIVATAGNMAWIDDLSVWRDAGKKLEENSFLSELIKTFSDQTAGVFTNISKTTGFKTISGYETLRNAYTREMDKALIKLCSGAFNQEKIVKDTVHDLAESGLRSIDFASGYSMQLDTAVRLALRTGYHQLAGKVTDRNIEQTSENLVYVSKHWGARNMGIGHANHEQWQGKVYFIKEGTDYSEEAQRIRQDRIMSLWYATGYSVDGSKENDPTGLYGYNCRHSHYPWFEGISTIPKESPEPEPVEIGGKVYDYYAVTQKMRAMERSVRALKREKEALKALGMDTTEITAKISRKTREYKEFCGQAGVKEKTSRLRYECGTSNLERTEAWKAYRELKKAGNLSAGNENIEIQEHEVPKHRETIDIQDADVVQSTLVKYESEIVDEPIENAIVITKSGEVWQCFGNLNGVYPDVDLGERLRGAWVTHNHPIGSSNEYSFSKNDINLFMKYDLEILRGIDERYIYELTRNANEIDKNVPIGEIDEFQARHEEVITIAERYGIGYRRYLRDK